MHFFITRCVWNDGKHQGVFEVFVGDSIWSSATPPTSTLMCDTNNLEPWPFLGSGPRFWNRGSETIRLNSFVQLLSSVDFQRWSHFYIKGTQCNNIASQLVQPNPVWSSNSKIHISIVFVRWRNSANLDCILLLQIFSVSLPRKQWNVHCGAEGARRQMSDVTMGFMPRLRRHCAPISG